MGTIIHKRLTDAGKLPNPDEMAPGELALNVTDGFLYTKNEAGQLIWLNPIGAPLSASYAVTASYAVNASQGSSAWDDITNKPVGLVSSSVQVNSGSFTGSFTGSVTSAVSSSYATTSSYSSVAQTLLGSIESASYALTASYAANGGGASSETASYAHTASYAQFSRNQMVVAFSGSGATFVQYYPLALNQWSFSTSTSTSPSVNYIYIYPFIAPSNAGALTFKLKNIQVYHTTTMTDRHGSFAVYSNKPILLQPDMLLYSSSAVPIPTGVSEVTADVTLEAGKIYWVAFHRNIGGPIQVAASNTAVNTLYGATSTNPGSYISVMRSASAWGDSASYAPAWPSTVNWEDFGNQTSSAHAINIAGSFAIIE